MRRPARRANPPRGWVVPLRAAGGFRWRQKTMPRRASPQAGDGRIVTDTPAADHASVAHPFLVPSLKSGRRAGPPLSFRH
ncbi:hypothetical protein SJ05684_b60300 (plasmid) [Sinorhizobium sojae CCBAU 05684]|uniref:Uncharacterized protein n=1 Tax=Sinorhizobium sojae CCBAU 05684 TaxID=716928 RepID=A0A249PMR6_9HYPH|nr:hypothetical protein SJ05684_b60300 [Sinorhizobium sojae CCBAU 05684]